MAPSRVPLTATRSSEVSARFHNFHIKLCTVVSLRFPDLQQLRWTVELPFWSVIATFAPEQFGRVLYVYAMRMHVKLHQLIANNSAGCLEHSPRSSYSMNRCGRVYSATRCIFCITGRRFGKPSQRAQWFHNRPRASCDLRFVTMPAPREIYNKNLVNDNALRFGRSPIAEGGRIALWRVVS